MSEITLASVQAELLDLKSKMLEGFDKTNAQLAAIAGMQPTVLSINTTINETANNVNELVESDSERGLAPVFKRLGIPKHTVYGSVLAALKAYAQGSYSRVTEEDVEAFFSAHPDFTNVCSYSLFGDRPNRFPRPSLYALAYVQHYNGLTPMFENFMKKFDGGGSDAAALMSKHCLEVEGYSSKYSKMPFRMAACFYATFFNKPFDPAEETNIQGWTMLDFIGGKK